MNWHELFIYDLVTGRLLNKVTRSPKALAGCEAGTVQRDGYRRVSLNHKKVAVHRIAWDINNPLNKVQPYEQIDHLDHNRTNNRPLNLEKKSNADNHKNMSMQKNNKSGIAGVYFNAKEKLWYAQIFLNNSKTHLGCFKCLLDAAAARKSAEKQMDFHKNHGK